MDSQDLHELAISYCETIFSGKNPTPKAYLKKYLKAIRDFEKEINKQMNEEIGGIEVIEEIKSNITALNEKEAKDDLIF